MQCRHRHRDHRIAAEPRLVRRAVQFDQFAVDRILIGDRHGSERRGDLAVDIRHCALDPVPAKSRSTISQLDGLVHPRRGACRGDGATARTAVQKDLGLDRGTAARVPNPPADDPFDTCLGHSMPLIRREKLAHPHPTPGRPRKKRAL